MVKRMLPIFLRSSPRGESAVSPVTARQSRSRIAIKIAPASLVLARLNMLTAWTSAFARYVKWNFCRPKIVHKLLITLTL